MWGLELSERSFVLLATAFPLMAASALEFVLTIAWCTLKNKWECNLRISTWNNKTFNGERGTFKNRAVAIRKWSLKYSNSLWLSLCLSLEALLCKDEFYRQWKLNFQFLKILTLLAIQNHVREAFVTLDIFGLSQSFLASQLSENEMQKARASFL